MKVALVYDRVNKWGGAERVLLSLHKLFPDAPLYTSVYSNEVANWAKKFPKVHTSFIQSIPFAKNNHEFFAPLMPIAFEAYDFSNYDIVISVTSEAAKGIITKPGTKHICYCLTPPRYLWNSHAEYFKNSFTRTIFSPLIKYLRNWDKIAAARPDHFISISQEVQQRVKKYYKINSNIIYPPVELSKFMHSSNIPKKSDYFLLVSRFVKYKKIDLAIRVFNELNKKLIIIGQGREEARLKTLANKNIVFIKSKLTDEELKRYYTGAKALILPQVEDFGLVALESQAAGTPVIALEQGGAKETVINGLTGITFKNQNETDLLKAISKFEKTKFFRENLIRNAKRFDKETFNKAFLNLIKNL